VIEGSTLTRPSGGGGGGGYRFCTETPMLLHKWAATLKRLQHVELRAEVHRMQDDIRCKDLELRELKRLLRGYLGDAGFAMAAGARRGSVGFVGLHRQPTDDELQASIKLQAATRGRLSRQHSGTYASYHTGSDSERSMATSSRRVSTAFGTAFSDAGRDIGRGVSNAFTAFAKVGAIGLEVGTVAAEAVGDGVASAVQGVHKKSTVDGGHGHEHGNVAAGRGSSACGTPPVTSPVLAPSTPPSLPPAPSSGVADERVALGLKPLSQEATCLRTNSDERAITGANGAAHEAVSALHERGERLKSMAKATDNLASEAETFADNARRIRQQAEKRSSSLWPF